MAKKVNLNKVSRGFLKKIFSRVTLFSILFIAQVVGLIAFMIYFTQYYVIYFWFDFVVRLIALLIMVFKKSETPYRTSWLLIHVLFPVMGPLIYIVISLDPFPYQMRRRIKVQADEIALLQTFNQKNIKELSQIDDRYTGIANYLSYSTAFPTFKNNPLKYYESGEASLKDLLDDFKAAKHFIFLEFFIVKNGTILQEVLTILHQKAKEGVQIKFLYDGFSAMLSLPFTYHKMLSRAGIETRVFSVQKTPFFHRESYRSHRKSIIIDGQIAYVGGVNLADEYFNRINRFGYWKDAMLRVEGDSVNSLTLSFLSMWDHQTKQPLDKSEYLVKQHAKYDCKNYVIPYSDSPLDVENTGFNVYLEIVNKATNYIYISSPYLVIDSEFHKALTYAAKRGVDVRILLPSIPDKKIPNFIAKSYYKDLIGAGIKIYEYLPGFNHAKMFVSDDVVFSLGSINLDYRSFFLSYENAIFAYDPLVAVEIKNDLIKAYKQSKKIDEKANKKIPAYKKVIGFIFRLFAPLL